MELHENTLDRLVTVLNDRIDGIIENNIEILSQPGVSDYYRELLNKDTRQCKSDLMLLSTAYDTCDMETLSGLSKTYLKESEQFQEADKARFVNAMWQNAGCDGEDCKAYNRYEKQDTIDFYNKHQEIKMDWQSKDTSIVTLWDTMDDYYNRSKKINPKALFKNKDMFEIVYENDDWLFVAPLNYEAAVDMDSFRIGGYGAKWCIGTKGDPRHWKRYLIENNSAFVLAYNKNTWANSEEQKYMLQIQEGALTVWPQDDNPNETFEIMRAKDKFQITWDQVKGWFEQLYDKQLSSIGETVTTFDLGKVLEQKKTICLDKSTEFSSIHLEGFDIAGGNFVVSQLRKYVKGIEKVGELYYSAKEYPMKSSLGQILLFPVFRCIAGNSGMLSQELHKPQIALSDLDMIAIGKFFLSSEDRGPRLWFKTKKLTINNLYIPSDSNENEIHELLESGASAEEVFRLYARLSSAIDLNDVEELKVSNVFVNSTEFAAPSEENLLHRHSDKLVLDLACNYECWSDYTDVDGNLDIKKLVNEVDGNPDYVPEKIVVYNLPQQLTAYWDTKADKSKKIKIYHCIRPNYLNNR